MKTIMFSLICATFCFQAFAATWIVDDDGGLGVDFTDIPPAILAASSGDTILVKNGTYSQFNLNKALILIADTNQSPSMAWKSDSQIYNIPAGKSAVVSGFSMTINCSLFIHDCPGHVILDQCQIKYARGAHPTLRIYNCDQVGLSRLNIDGMTCDDYDNTIYETARFRNSNVIVSQSVFEGSHGGSSHIGHAYDGTPALTTENCTAFFQASQAFGGIGGESYSFLPAGEGGDGAPGISVVNSHMELFGKKDLIIQGGAKGYGPGGDGFSSEALHSKNSTVAYSGYTFKTSNYKPKFKIIGGGLTHVSPHTPLIILQDSGMLGGYIRVTLLGEANSQYGLFLSTTQAIIPVINTYTQWLLHPGLMFFLGSGVINSSNPPSYKFALPLSAPWQGIPVNFQAYLITAQNKIYMSTSSSFVIR